MNPPPRRIADIPVSQITAFSPPRRVQQAPLKSTGSLSSLSPLWFNSCPRSGGLITEATEATEKEGLGDGADVVRTAAARQETPNHWKWWNGEMNLIGFIGSLALPM
jgi:hypothetical protein